MKATLNGIPSDAVPVEGFNAVDITDTTAREIIPAPAATLRLYITEVVAVNRTDAESPVLQLLDSTPTVKVGALIPAKPTIFAGVNKFDPPIKCALGTAFQGKATTAVGDSVVTARGYIGS